MTSQSNEPKSYKGLIGCLVKQGSQLKYNPVICFSEGIQCLKVLHFFNFMSLSVISVLDLRYLPSKNGHSASREIFILNFLNQHCQFDGCSKTLSRTI